MAAYFFDASGIVKRYVVETGTAWVQGLADPSSGNSVYLARISIVEVTSAITRRQRGGSIPAPDAANMLAQFRQDVAADYRILEVTAPLLSATTLLAESQGCGLTMPYNWPWSRSCMARARQRHCPR
jgi:hypothetical protein